MPTAIRTARPNSLTAVIELPRIVDSSVQTALLTAYLTASTGEVRTVVAAASIVEDIDTDGVAMLLSIAKHARKHGVSLVLAAPQHRFRKAMRFVGVHKKITMVAARPACTTRALNCAGSREIPAGSVVFPSVGGLRLARRGTVRALLGSGTGASVSIPLDAVADPFGPV